MPKPRIQPVVALGAGGLMLSSSPHGTLESAQNRSMSFGNTPQVMGCQFPTDGGDPVGTVLGTSKRSARVPAALPGGTRPRPS